MERPLARPQYYLILFLCLLTSFRVVAQPPTSRTSFQLFRLQDKGIAYSVDPRIELWQTVMLIAGNPQINGIDIDYKLLIIDQFGAYKHHTLMEFIRKYAPQGKLFTSIDAPIWYMLHLTPEFEWRRDIPNPYQQVPLLDSLRMLLKGFVQQTNYVRFFNQNAPFFQRALSDLQFNLTGQDEKRRLLEYYGVNPAKPTQFNVILNFLGYGNFGPRLETSTKNEFYAILAPTGNYDRLPTFSSVDLYGLIWHEFGHSFANPLIEEQMAELSALSALWEPIKASMQSQAYQEWKVVLWEHLVNAVMCRLAAAKHGENYSEINYVRPLLGKRWIYLNPLLEALKVYEASRTTYPTLRSFMPKLVDVFRQIQPQQIEQWQQQTLAIRQPDVKSLPVLGDIYGLENIVFILATGEPNSAAHTRLMNYLKAHQEAYFPTAKLVDDTLALRMDLSANHLFVIGTPWGNRFLQHVLPQLPIRLRPKEVVAGKPYTGDGYTFMSGWINPANPQNVMVIYTAQDPDDLVNFAQIPRGSTHFHLAKHLITLKAENYQRRNQIWICP